MTTTAAQREAWTAAGSNDAAQATYTSIRAALKDIMARRNVEVFLQGSYANATNVRADSDVDIVVMTKQTYTANPEVLSSAVRQRWDALPTATYHEKDLRAEVTAALVSYYGSSRVTSRNKCIQVDGVSGTVDADVVPCLQYRRYVSSTSDLSSGYIEGIAITPIQGPRIINYPKRHIKNGQDKNARCAERYKSTVRQMKRLRTRTVDQGGLPEGLAPGYLLECMTYNIPDGLFVADDSQRLLGVLAYLKNTDKSEFWSCDGVHKLFKTDPGNFSTTTAQQIIEALWEEY